MLLKFILNPSLCQVAAVKVVITLWTHEDIINEILKKYMFYNYNSKGRKSWKDIEDKVIQKICNLCVPQNLKTKLLSYVRPIGCRLLHWMESNRKIFAKSAARKHLGRVYWTSVGTIDVQKTVRALIDDKSLASVLHYRLACVYCVKESICKLWNSIDPKRFHDKDLEKIRVEEPFLVYFWSHLIQGEISKLNDEIRNHFPRHSPFIYAFQTSASRNEEAATRYFWTKLTPDEEERFLVSTAGHVIKSIIFNGCSSDLLCFLVSVMNENQQLEFFKSYPVFLLTSLLSWPWQEFFMETVDVIKPFLTDECIFNLLIEIQVKIKRELSDYNYKELFTKFWLQCPALAKKYVIEKCCSQSLLVNLFDSGDIGNIGLIINEANDAEKERILLSTSGKNIRLNLIRAEKWDLLQFFVEKCVSSKHAVNSLIEEFDDIINWMIFDRTSDYKAYLWDKILPILSKITVKIESKRTSNQENLSADDSNKKFKNSAHSKS